MRIFLCMPTHNGSANLWAARAFYRAPSARLPLFYAESSRSLLANCFNLLWAGALNLAKQERLTHFVMLHSDVIPEDFWVDRLYEEITRTQAAVVSTVLPIKDIQGITSTAISAAGEDEWEVERRLTMREVYSLPETFSAADCGYPDRALLVNTGCWIADLSFFEDKRIGFEIRDRLTLREGFVAPQCIPEDWNFSREVHQAGGKVLATRKIKAQHVGSHAFTNEQAWGMSIDPMALSKEPLPVFQNNLVTTKEG